MYRLCTPFACLLLLVLAGCAGGPPRHAAHPPDWESEEFASAPAVPPAPAVVPKPVTPPPPPAPTNRPAETWIALDRWCKANGLRPPLRLAVTPLPTYALSANNGVFVLRAGSQLAHWNGLELRLGFAPHMIDGQPFVHALDLNKTIHPLIGRGSKRFLTADAQHRQQPDGSPVIVIDPGHGGENAGTKSVLGKRYEKEFTLDWARRLQPLLACTGWRVFLTRTNDMDLALSNRVTFAEEHKATLFLSLHFNSAAPNEAEAGLETYCLTPTGLPSTVTRGFSDDLGQAFPNNAFDAQNLQLALQVHRALLQVTGNRDRGVRRARFLGVLRGQQRPAILVEGGYLSNPREARQIADPEYRQKLAEAVARGLAIEN
jgi:N-acetylmuramoyl-L-alanine amidase